MLFMFWYPLLEQTNSPEEVKERCFSSYLNLCRLQSNQLYDFGK